MEGGILKARTIEKLNILLNSLNKPIIVLVLIERYDNRY